MQLQVFIQLAIVGLAGSAGAVSRYLLGRFVAKHVRWQIPLGTLLINVSGAFLIGLLFVVTSRHMISSTIQTVLATGFLGGYTTSSTMSWESVLLIRGRNQRASLLYLGSTVLFGLLAVTLGFALGSVI